jgi:hypothetical protein
MFLLRTQWLDMITRHLGASLWAGFLRRQRVPPILRNCVGRKILFALLVVSPANRIEPRAAVFYLPVLSLPKYADSRNDIRGYENTSDDLVRSYLVCD